MYEGPKIDCDVHHVWADQADLLGHLPKAWTEFIELPVEASVSLDGRLVAGFGPSRGHVRLESIPKAGGPGGSDYETLRLKHLDPNNIEHAILTYDVGQNPGLANVYLASELARAMNDWSIEHWLGIDDDRLHGALAVPTQMPDEAAAEVRRVGGHPKIAEVLLVANGLGRPFGHPLYHPIYEAAAEMDLPVAIHVTDEDLYKVLGGVYDTRVELYTAFAGPMEHHLASFITHGVFEKFPTLKVILKEAGVSWLPFFVWELDALYPSLRRESAWVRRPPSEYVREHIRLGTQPIDISPKRKDLIELLEAFGGMEDILCLTTDWPHWDADNPDYVATRLPKEWLPKVFYENAAKFYGWPLSPAHEATARRLTSPG